MRTDHVKVPVELVPSRRVSPLLPTANTRPGVIGAIKPVLMGALLVPGIAHVIAWDGAVTPWHATKMIAAYARVSLSSLVHIHMIANRRQAVYVMAPLAVLVVCQLELDQRTWACSSTRKERHRNRTHESYPGPRADWCCVSVDIALNNPQHPP